MIEIFCKLNKSVKLVNGFHHSGRDFEVKELEVSTLVISCSVRCVRSCQAIICRYLAFLLYINYLHMLCSPTAGKRGLAVNFLDSFFSRHVLFRVLEFKFIRHSLVGTSCLSFFISKTMCVTTALAVPFCWWISSTCNLKKKYQSNITNSRSVDMLLQYANAQNSNNRVETAGILLRMLVAFCRFTCYVVIETQSSDYISFTG